MITKTLSTALLLGLITTSLNAKGMNSPQKIFQKKCNMCHNLTKPKNKQEKMKMTAPPISIAMRSVIIGVDAIEGPVSDSELRELSIEFLTDYLKEPSQEKGYCEDMSYKKFGTMPSMKGFMTDKQIDTVVPWVIDNFSPKKDANGKYIIHSKRK
ncbi:MAG: c-type cytochrome [Campylobacterota bacterium]|nr:c-type cytochrome [Campylobacterota bacterium]